MKKADNYDNSDGLNISSLALMVFSIGAILGAVISLVISRLNQVKSSLRQAQLPSPSDPEGGSGINEINTFETVSPSILQPGAATPRIPQLAPRSRQPHPRDPDRYPEHRSVSIEMPRIGQ